MVTNLLPVRESPVSRADKVLNEPYVARMKPPLFDYVDPDSVAGVLQALASAEDAVIIAGGQSLVPLLNLRLVHPDLVVDIRRVPGLEEIVVPPARSASVVSIGARVTARALLEHPVSAEIPMLARALSDLAHPQIRSRTTIGGTIAHADPAAELPTVLVAMGGSVVLAGPDGERSVDAADFFVGPYMTARGEDELVVRIDLPMPGGPSSWREVARRAGDFALVGTACAVTFADGDPAAEVTTARIGLCGVGGTPHRYTAAEEVLVGRPLDDLSMDGAVATLADLPGALDDQHASARHRRALAAAVVRDALLDVRTAA